MQYPELNKTYLHYKGGLYEVITLANDAEKKDKALVVYKSLLFGGVYVRPLSEWFEYMINNTQRYTLVEK